MKEAKRKSHGEIGAQTQKHRWHYWHFGTLTISASEKREAKHKSYGEIGANAENTGGTIDTFLHFDYFRFRKESKTQELWRNRSANAENTGGTIDTWHFDTFTSEKKSRRRAQLFPSDPLFIFPQAFVPYRQQSGIVSYISLKRDMGMVKLKRFDSK